MCFDVRCHHCGHWMGEAREPMVMVGMFENPRERGIIPPPRDTWRCPSCGWGNVFRVATSWRVVETKDLAPKAATG